MDFEQLHTLITVSETGSFSITAEKLNITQPAVSKRIDLLEKRLGQRLIDRIGKTNRLTQAGVIAVKHANSMLHQQHILHHELDNLQKSVSGRLSISTSHHIGLHRLPYVLKRYVRKYPNVDLDMNFTDSEIAYQDVINGKTLLAIATLPTEKLAPHIQLTPLWQDNLKVVCSKHHPMAKDEKLNIDNLQHHKAILPGIETFTRRIIDHFFKENNLSLKIAFETNYLETIRIMVSSGLGWSILPEILLDEDIIALEVKTLQLNRLLGTIINKSVTLPNSALAMLDLLRQESKFSDN